MTLSWTNPGDDSITGYQFTATPWVHEGTINGHGWRNIELEATRTTLRPSPWPNLKTDGSLYYFSVRAVNAQGAGGYATATALPKKPADSPAQELLPALQWARVNGAELALRFDKALDESSAPGAGALCPCSVAEAATRGLGGVGEAGPGDADAGAGGVGGRDGDGRATRRRGRATLRSTDGGEVAAFSGQAVTNDTPAPGSMQSRPPPEIGRAASRGGGADGARGQGARGARRRGVRGAHPVQRGGRDEGEERGHPGRRAARSTRAVAGGRSARTCGELRVRALGPRDGDGDAAGGRCAHGGRTDAVRCRDGDRFGTGTARAQRGGRERARGPRRHHGLRGDALAGGLRQGHGALRDAQRHGEEGQGLRQGQGQARLRRGRDVEDGLGGHPRRRARRGCGDLHGWRL